MAVSRVIKLQHHRIAQVCFSDQTWLHYLGHWGRLSKWLLQCIFVHKVQTFLSCQLLVCHPKWKSIAFHPTDWTKSQAWMQIECQFLRMIPTLKWLVLFQCRTVKITIFGDEGVPVQVDGEAWVQPPGIIKIVHKNRAQMLTRDRVCNKNIFPDFYQAFPKNSQIFMKNRNQGKRFKFTLKSDI